MASFTQLPWLFIFGLLGNIVSFMVFLSPMPTFCTIIKKKSTEGFKCLPYLASLFSSMLWIYYAYIKTNACLLITINSVGCIIETIYIVIFISYAPKKIGKLTLQQLIFFDFGGFFLLAIVSHFFTKGNVQVALLGWVCLVFSIIVFAAPLSIMRQVIRTKSVEFMPFSLSLFLTLNAIMWFFYGMLQKDVYVALPNVIGFAFGVFQMVLYIIFKYYINKKVTLEQNLPTVVDKQGATPTSEVRIVCSSPKHDENEEKKDQNIHEKNNQDETSDASNQV